MGETLGLKRSDEAGVVLGGGPPVEGMKPYAQLAGPVPKLVAAVGHRVGLHRVEGGVPGEHSGELVSFGGLWIEAEVGQHLG